MNSSLETRGWRLVPPALLAALLVAAALPAAQLSGQVRAATGEAIPARVLIRNMQSRESVELYTDPAGAFKTEVPDGKLRVLATHGPEWSIAEQETEGGAPLELVLTRLVDMPARGYYGTDLHMHSTCSDGAQSPAEVALACQAEGLHVAALSDHNTIAHHGPWLATRAPGFLPLLAQEVTTHYAHILGTNAPALVDHNIQRPEGLLDIFAAIHAQGALAIVAHPNAPGCTYQAPQIREYDGMEILNGLMPAYGPVFEALQGRKLWHELLSQGRRVPAVGNSDNHDVLSTKMREVLRDPDAYAKTDKRLATLRIILDFQSKLEPFGWKGHHPGIFRTYLHLDGPPTPEGVQAAVKQGRGFATNGPIIITTLDGQLPGSEIAANDRPSVPFSAELHANRPLERLVILVNGKEAITMGTNAAQAQVTVPVKAGDWVVAELYGQWPEFATTNAWYVR